WPPWRQSRASTRRVDGRFSQLSDWPGACAQGQTGRQEVGRQATAFPTSTPLKGWQAGMGFAQVLSRAQAGLAAPQVAVEVHLGSGLPTFTIVGLPAAAVKESRERVRAALATCGFELPAGRITVNL